MMSSDDEEAQIRDEDHRYRAQVPLSATNTQQDGCVRVREISRKSRLKRVVSFRRKTHHHPTIQRRASSPVRSTHTRDRAAESREQISEDHHLLMEALHGRRLRLSLALTLWRRSAGELLAFLERLQDSSVLVDCLPVLTRSLQEECAGATLGLCVDLFPLVNSLLHSHFQHYLITALMWIQAVLKRWSSLLIRDTHTPDNRNALVLKQQLQDLWMLKSHLTSASETTAHIWTVIESHLAQF